MVLLLAYLACHLMQVYVVEKLWGCRSSTFSVKAKPRRCNYIPSLLPLSSRSATVRWVSRAVPRPRDQLSDVQPRHSGTDLSDAHLLGFAERFERWQNNAGVTLPRRSWKPGIHLTLITAQLFCMSSQAPSVSVKGMWSHSAASIKVILCVEQVLKKNTMY